jgi:hypothetical protein
VGAVKRKSKLSPPEIVAWLEPWEDCPCGSREHQKGGHDKGFVPSVMPLGPCPNVPSPCGHCWYCKQREVRP